MWRQAEGPSMQRPCRGPEVRKYGVVQDQNIVHDWRIGFEEGGKEGSREKTGERRSQTASTEPCKQFGFYPGDSGKHQGVLNRR